MLLSALLDRIRNDESLTPELASSLLVTVFNGNKHNHNSLEQLRNAAIERLERNGFFSNNDDSEEILKSGIMLIGGDFSDFERASQICLDNYPRERVSFEDRNATQHAAISVVGFILDLLGENRRAVFPGLPEPRMISLEQSLKTFCTERGIPLGYESPSIDKIATITPRSFSGKTTFDSSYFRNKVVIAYWVCEACGMGYHHYAMANELREKWKNYPVEFVLCCSENENLQLETLKYFSAAMPHWNFASIKIGANEHGADRVPGLTVIDKRGRIRFDGIWYEDLYADPFVDKLIGELLRE
jgi:hypothetical protein